MCYALYEETRFHGSWTTVRGFPRSEVSVSDFWSQEFGKGSNVELGQGNLESPTGPSTWERPSVFCI